MIFMVIFMVPDPRSISSRRARKGARSARSAHAVQITPLTSRGYPALGHLIRMCQFVGRAALSTPP